ncbi:PepSY-like domain-containing protein [Gimesia aquarii]|uniref:Beta-lactamase-inhibitor-like PepSY-like domain-containing protein n=1 Tax=Gimesia aquarii TaxID=2527964 RepID=A0A517VXQ3_9PLAN|nr:PepSY-like domain-containing protein [Gimesia aquarii]QDT97779.1 hypothetical protein V144x_32610 [Gimesia aquarii]
MTNNSKFMRNIGLAIVVCGLLASASFAYEALTYDKLPSAVKKNIESLHPNSRVLTANIDEDGLYQIDVNANNKHFLVELTRSGRVVSNKSQGKVLKSTPKSVNLPARVRATVKKLYPNGNVVSAAADEDGVYQIQIKSPQGISNVESTRSGRILSNDRDATDKDEDLSISPSLQARHIESVRKLPYAVLAAVEKAHPQGVIVHVYQDLYGPRYGRSAYYVNIVKNNEVYNVGLTATGKVLKDTLDNQTERLARLPQVVSDTAKAAFPNGVIYGSGTRNGNYEVDVLVDGLPYDLVITKSGHVISKKRDYHE